MYRVELAGRCRSLQATEQPCLDDCRISQPLKQPRFAHLNAPPGARSQRLLSYQLQCRPQRWRSVRDRLKYVEDDQRRRLTSSAALLKMRPASAVAKDHPPKVFEENENEFCVKVPKFFFRRVNVSWLETWMEIADNTDAPAVPSLSCIPFDAKHLIDQQQQMGRARRRAGAAGRDQVRDKKQVQN